MRTSDNSPATNPESRNLELDFLRGVAVIFVLIAHHRLIRYGGFALDLLFVLSGFLIAGLLFSEYKSLGRIHPFHFFVRRGFKLYPLYYLSISVTYVYILFSPPYGLNYKGAFLYLLPEIFFYQNYRPVFWPHHWTLAVEEHFYILISMLVFILARARVLERLGVFLPIAFFIFGSCLALRVHHGLHSTGAVAYLGTHLRMDSLFAGVLLGHFYHFRRQALKEFYDRHKKLLALLILARGTVAVLPFIPYGALSHTLWYVTFSALIVILLFSERAGAYLRRVFTPRVYHLICRTGFYSYSIYLLHLYVMKFVIGEEYFAEHSRIAPTPSAVLSFVVYFALSILLGVAASLLIEIPFLRLRDRYFPRRSRVRL